MFVLLLCALHTPGNVLLISCMHVYSGEGSALLCIHYHNECTGVQNPHPISHSMRNGVIWGRSVAILNYYIHVQLMS